MGLFDKIREGLRKTRESISGQISQMVNSFTKIDEELFEELEELLIMGDVGMDTAEFITGELRRVIKEKGITDPSLIMDELQEIVAQLLSGDCALHIDTKPSVVLVIGVNGVGKTTAIGKLSARLKAEGKSVMLAAADTFRAAAIEQLEVWSQRAGVPMIKHGEGSDPAAVIFDTIAAAKARGVDVIICDTAGRLHNKKNLMDELSKISRVIDRELPGCDRENLLVLDAATGQNAVNQAREFMGVAAITGIVLTKLDGTPKGGVVLPIKRELDLPVKFIGVGEQIDDLEPFDPAAFAAGLFDTQGRTVAETEPEFLPNSKEKTSPDLPSEEGQNEDKVKVPSTLSGVAERETESRGLAAGAASAPAHSSTDETIPAQPENIPEEDKHKQFRRFAEDLMARIDRGEDISGVVPELNRWRDDRELERDDQRLVRNLLLTAGNLSRNS